ncbi:GntR family transcriptional regulator [Bosea sp. CER48]|uniref:GntR family transcriptional regulator n=1 Tax=Bosea sp. CER48 TaxID=3377035 RepID=UPI0037F1E0D8
MTASRPPIPKPPFQELLQLRSDTAKPLYQQLENELVRLIGDGILPPGTTLPAERQLAERLSISRTTVQRSYNALRQRKMLSAQGRLGSIVQGPGPRLHSGMDRLKGFTEEMRELGREPSSQILERRVVKDRLIASVFGEPSHTSFLKLARIRSGDGVPMSREIAWYNLGRVPGLEQADLSGSVYARLAGLGQPLVRCDQSIEAAAPTSEECAIFGFEHPAPCLLIKRRSFCVDGGMLEYVEGLFRGDTYTYRLTLKV